MTKYKGIIRLEDKPFKLIKWFTENFDNEIGALGIGKVKNGEMVIEKLVFPTQIVSGAHVHFKPSDWGTIVRELTEEELNKVIFYWHKHPGGCPGASQGDEDDTFDVFMGEESKRKIFGFLQTAYTKAAGMTYEARIEQRKPIWASIEADMITSEDETIEAECLQIIKDKVTKGFASARDQPGSKVAKTPTHLNKGMTINYSNRVVPQIDVNNIPDTVTFDVKESHGAVNLTVSTPLSVWIEEQFKCEPFVELISKVRVFDDIDSGETLFKIQPKKKMLQTLINTLEDWELEMESEAIDREIDAFDASVCSEKTIEEEVSKYLQPSYADVQASIYAGMRSANSQFYKDRGAF